MKHTILHTIETGGPGGAETILLNLASGLDPARYQSLALVAEEGWLRSQLRARNVETVVRGTNGWLDPRPLWSFLRLLREKNVALIHSHLPDQNFISCLAGTLGRRATVATYHGALEGSGVKFGLKLGTVRRCGNVIVAVSESLASSLRRRGFPANKVACIPNGIDVARFRGVAAGRVRSELRVSPETPLVGMMANYRKDKGHEFFLEAARIIVQTIPQCHFVAAGDVSPENRELLSSRLQKLSLEKQFAFLGFRQDVPEFLADLDVFVLPSTSEGFSLATVEAMAAGRPVVVTRSGGPEEIVEDGRSGILVPAGDPESLARAVIHVLQQPEMARTMGQEARTRTERAFSLSRMIRDYENLYDRVLQAEKP